MVLAVNLDRCRCRKVSRHLSRNGRRQLRYRGGVEEQPNRTKNKSLIDPSGVEKLSRIQTHSRSIYLVSRSYRDCNKKKLKKLDKQQGIEEVLSQLLKPVFRDEKNTNMNAIQHATHKYDPINILSSQNHLSIKKI